MLQIVWVLATHVPARRIFYPNRSLGWCIRSACEKLGSTFVKIGQLLAARPEFFTQEDLAELKHLFSKARDLPFETIKTESERELGMRLEDAFATFNPHPMASASIGQVHQATLHTGMDVAVKVMYPGIKEEIRRDTRILRTLLVAAYPFFRSVRHFRALRVLRQVEGWLAEETDFRRERANTELMRSVCAVHPELVIPRTFKNLSTERILTLELIEGISLNDDMHAENPPDGYDIRASIQNLIDTMLGPLFKAHNRPFHADLHPGNVIALPGGRVGLIDFGLVGWISPMFLEDITNTLFSVYLGDVEGAAEGSLHLCNSNATPTSTYLRDMRRYVKRAPHLGFARWFLDVGKIMLDHRLTPPLEFSLVAKFVLVIDGLAEQYIPSHTTTSLVGHIIEEAMMERAMQRLERLSPKGALLILSEIISGIPPALLRKMRAMNL
jgi:ubiquinone biosynthesis protein